MQTSLQHDLPLEGFVDDPSHSYTLPSAWYYDRQLFELEREKIFHQDWYFACHRSEVSKPGDYVAVDILGESVVVIRDKDSELRGFFNVCQHRGHKLLTGRGGGKSAITCPYHAWTYNLDGKLRGAKYSEKVPGFDKADFCLPEVHVAEFAGFVFVSIADNPRPMESRFPGLEKDIDKWYPTLGDMVLYDRTDFDIDANWKVVVENAIEGYHFHISGPCHQSFAETMHDDDSSDISNQDGWIRFLVGPGMFDNSAYPFPENGGGVTDHYSVFVLFPNLALYTLPYANFVSAFLTVPLGPEKSRLESYMYVPAGVEIDETTEKAVEFFNTRLSPEDISLNLGVQAGLRSKGYNQGRFIINPDQCLRSEHTVHYFQKMVRDAVLA